MAKALSFFFLFLSVSVPYRRISFQVNLKNVLDGLLYQEKLYEVGTNKRVAIGFGSCWDSVTDGVEFLKQAHLVPPQTPCHYDIISTSEDLSKVFAFFFQNGAAAERFTDNKDLFDKLKNIANTMNTTRWTIGGNAPIIAQRLAQEGWDVLLAAKMNKETADMLHSSIKLVSESTNEVEEDVHLILEYDLGARWGPYSSPRANRFIVHNDHSNMLLESLEGFEDVVSQFKPDLLIVGGLQMLDNFVFDDEIRTNRLQQLEQLLRSLPDSTKIHFEMASFSEQKLLEEILQYVIPYVDSIGMNEQELANLYSLLVHGNISIVSDYSPRIAITLDQARGVYQTLKDRKTKGHSLTRLHIHTLAYQAIYTVQNAGWQHTKSAVAKASLVANRHVCASSYININYAKLIMDDSFSVSCDPNSSRVPFVDTTPVSCWYEGEMKFCVAPNLICTEVSKTAAAGDNISAAGLSIQI